ncbi:Splicing factor 3b subunit 4 protein [Dioscorea alata]|uniref:Splicing factor 3b subunit 4 protein n=1 Tax=Dioscorea alata TaxID=55571 RepID=A0ACB7TTG4_DIOAL|nr:Splicing factor 3b subunit 4 protein [Dioscorea alata]
MASVKKSSGSQSSPGAALEVVEATQKDVGELTKSFFKLNPYAKEFVPASHVDALESVGASEILLNLCGDSNRSNASLNQTEGDIRSISSFGNQQDSRRRGRQHFERWTSNDLISPTAIEDCIRRTIYVSNIEQHVTEEELAGLFSCCGHINDCRISGELSSVCHFAFLEFSSETSARAALSLCGTPLHTIPICIAPSKSYIFPINPSYLPRSAHEKDIARRTVYCNNIDKMVSEIEIQRFFESNCGPISRLRVLGNRCHQTYIAFIEFVRDDSAIAALQYTGFYLGGFPIRVIASKTPVRMNTSLSWHR